MAAMSCTQQFHLRRAQQLDRDGPGATLLHHHWFVTKDTDIRFDVQIQGGADSSLQLGGACGMEGLVQWVKCKNYKNNAMCNGQRHLVPNCTLIQTFVFHWRLFLGLQHN